MCVLINPLILFSDDPKRCIRRTTTDCRPYQSSHAECHLVAVEVVGLLAVFAVFDCPEVDLCQEFVAVGIGVDTGISAVPNESSLLFEAV